VSNSLSVKPRWGWYADAVDQVLHARYGADARAARVV
jgi:hypothetical protein